MRHRGRDESKSVASDALSWESGTGSFGGDFVLFTALCNASKIQRDCGQVADLWENIPKGNNSRKPK